MVHLGSLCGADIDERLHMPSSLDVRAQPYVGRRAIADIVNLGILTDLSIAKQDTHDKHEFVQNKNIRLDPENIASVRLSQSKPPSIIFAHMLCSALVAVVFIPCKPR